MIAHAFRVHISRRRDTDTTAEDLLKGLSTRGKLLPTREGGAPRGPKGEGGEGEGGTDTAFDRLLPALAAFSASYLSFSFSGLPFQF